MLILIKYVGEIKVNQLGVNYSFPHYSTVLGSVLSAYHKFMKTPKNPRIDMFQLASDLKLELLMLVAEKNKNSLNIEYSQFRNLEKKIKDDGNIYSPANRFVSKGEFYFLINCSDDNVLKSLINYSLILGSNESAVVDYKLEVFNDLIDFLKIYNNKLLFLSPVADYSYEARFNENNLDVCLVSQIKLKDLKLFCQGIYSSCEWKTLDSDFDIDFVSYSKIFDFNKNDLYKYINTINGVKNGS